MNQKLSFYTIKQSQFMVDKLSFYKHQANEILEIAYFDQHVLRPEKKVNLGDNINFLPDFCLENMHIMPIDWIRFFMYMSRIFDKVNECDYLESIKNYNGTDICIFKTSRHNQCGQISDLDIFDLAILYDDKYDPKIKKN